MQRFRDRKLARGKTFAAIGICILASVVMVVARSKTQTTAEPAQTSGNYEITSPLGTKFYSLADEKGVVADARKALAADPNNAGLMLKVAQAQAAVWQYREAVETCTKALETAPEEAGLYLERGHRQLGLREFGKAGEDLKRAATLDPKNPDVYYHLGLSHYFRGEFPQAADAFRHAVDLAPNTDNRINSMNWLYASLRRANQGKEAAAALLQITPEMTASGHSQFYLHLVRFFQGAVKEATIVPPQPTPGATDLEPELQFDTVAYGVGNWHLYNGEPQKAQAYFERIVKGRVWVTWGFVGAETELVRDRGAMPGARS